MILRLDPRWPLVWRTPTSLQLGVDPPVVTLEAITELEEQLLAALAVGVSESGLEMIARGRDDVRARLIDQLRPALERAMADPLASAAVTITGSGAFAPELAALLASRGVRILDLADDARPDLAVVIGHHVLAPALHAHWLRRDVPHLPVVFTDRAVHLGPIVEPGLGPCLLCLELHRRDADPAWPALASQLLGREGTSESPLTGREAAVVAARLVLARLTAGPASAHETVRIDAATGVRTARRREPHPECGCRGIASIVSLDPRQPSSARKRLG